MWSSPGALYLSYKKWAHFYNFSVSSYLNMLGIPTLDVAATWRLIWLRFHLRGCWWAVGEVAGLPDTFLPHQSWSMTSTIKMYPSWCQQNSPTRDQLWFFSGLIGEDLCVRFDVIGQKWCGLFQGCSYADCPQLALLAPAVVFRLAVGASWLNGSWFKYWIDRSYQVMLVTSCDACNIMDPSKHSITEYENNPVMLLFSYYSPCLSILKSLNIL